LRDDRWARIPSQAAIITSTVDQLGSRLLFRSYGDSPLAAPVYAGLAANDSLILLDEAHCSVPFLQTLRAVLGQVSDEESLARRLVKATVEFARAGKCRIGVIVNRVDRARDLARRLEAEAQREAPEGAPAAFDVHLLTGRIRPVERDLLVGRDAPLHRTLRSFEPEQPPRPLILVATQCLEVGADFSFDALATECASLDALRQRFGRLDRLGDQRESPAVILTADSLLKEPDPIYGEALKNTWDFLQRVAAVENSGTRRETKVVDFGVNALALKPPASDEVRSLLAPSPDAPMLLPAHLDLLCQTAPPPHPNPDLGPFLHGKGRGVPEVRVVWRCDLAELPPKQWKVEELRDALAAVRDWTPEDEATPPLPEWLRELLAAVQDLRFRDVAEHPGGGLVLRARTPLQDADEPDFFADEDDQPSDRPDALSLDAHTAEVESKASQLAVACLGDSAKGLFETAARWHDSGKLDPRFQELLYGGFPDLAMPLAKSPDLPRSRDRARAVRQAAGLPDGFRHEMLSLQLAERLALANLAHEDRDLLLRLIGSHHGHARPFAPVCEDHEPPAIDSKFGSLLIHVGTEERKAFTPPHRLDSGVSDRFWSLTRRFGWWGLAYREAILRLADWYASAHAQNAKRP
jgi:CRISPR-associated endonuclease Cas3-HD